MAGDVEIPPNNGSNDSAPEMQNDGTMSNMKNDGQRYEETRMTERHILFHFFTLFSISFIGGILLIHLSLWMNSYIHSTFFTPHFREDSLTVPDPSDLNHSHNAADDTHTWYTSIYTQDPRIKKLFQSPYYYTGEYFSDVNATVYTQQNFSSPFAVK